jgi:hypothetical protein
MKGTSLRKTQETDYPMHFCVLKIFYFIIYQKHLIDKLLIAAFGYQSIIDTSILLMIPLSSYRARIIAN